MCCYGALQILNLAEQEVSATMEHLLHSAHEHAVHPAAALAYLNAELDRIHVVMGNEYRTARAACDAEKRRSANECSLYECFYICSLYGRSLYDYMSVPYTSVSIFSSLKRLFSV